MNPKNALSGGLLLITWWACVLLIGWQGQFPLNDDWSYAQTVQRWMTTGDFAPGGWTSMTLWVHAAWGKLFCSINGFSFEALRLAELTMGAFGMMGAFCLARQLGVSQRMAMLAGATLGFNPIYFDLSFTFMTDVTFTALLVWAALFVVRYLTHLRWSDWLLAVTFGLAATLCRQLGLCIFIGLAVGILLREGLRPSTILLAALPLGLGLGALWGFNHWLAEHGRTPALYHLKEAEMRELLRQPKAMVLALGRNLAITTTYLGLFLSPIALASAFKPAAGGANALRWRRVGQWSAIALLLAAVGLMLAGKRLMPVWANGMGQHGLGPLLLHDVITLKLRSVEPLPAWWALILSLITLAGIYTLFSRIVPQILKDAEQALTTRSKATPGSAVNLAMLMAAAAYMAPLLVMPDFFDRYIVVLIPLLLPLVLNRSPEQAANQPSPANGPTLALLAGVGAAAFLLLLSVGGTHDHMAWNRARWQAINDLTTRPVHPISPAELDGGFEFNALHFYDPAYKPKPGKSWWWVQEDRYLLAFAPLQGSTVVSRYPYHRWLPGADGMVWVLQRAPQTSGQTNTP